MPDNAGLGLCPASVPRALRKQPPEKPSKQKVLKMLAVMEAQQVGDGVNSHSQEFLTSGRTGRRNALPDILGEHAMVTSADLPARLQSLKTSDSATTTTSSTSAGGCNPTSSKPCGQGGGSGDERSNNGS